MDKHTYIEKKRDRGKLGQVREICLKCFRPLPLCLCAYIRPLDTQTRFIILMHPKEAKRTRNGTGRLTYLSLNNSELLFGVDFTQNSRLNVLISDPGYCPLILFPGEKSIPTSDVPAMFPTLKRRALLVIVIDGTWAAAKKMIKLSGNLHTIPQIMIQPTQLSRFKIKKQPHPKYLSTIEAIFSVLDTLDSAGFENLDGQHHNLIAVFDRLVRTQLAYIQEHSRSGFRRNSEKTTGEIPHA